MRRKEKVQALKTAAAQGPTSPFYSKGGVKLLIRVLEEADKIAIRDGIDAHTKLVSAIDAVLDSVGSN